MSLRPRSWSRPVWGLVGLLVAYYAFPVDLGDSLVSAAVGMVLTFGGLALLATMLAKELNHVRRGQVGRDPQVLAMMVVLLVMSSSLAFFVVDLLWPGQIVGLDTRTDALYFTLSTMSTVGFGDVHAEGQVARALVCCLIVFNVVVIASLVRLVAGRNPSRS
jgi:voltage-gated potassium channel